MAEECACDAYRAAMWFKEWLPRRRRDRLVIRYASLLSDPHADCRPMFGELQVLKIVGERLEMAGVALMLTGSFANAYYGQPRMTRDLDLIVRKGSEYRQTEFSRRRHVTIDSVKTWIASCEDLILSKLVWARESGWAAATRAPPPAPAPCRAPLDPVPRRHAQWRRPAGRDRRCGSASAHSQSSPLRR